MSFFSLTPVKEYGGILFKRDDKFAPWSDLSLNGGKVRQAIFLIENNLVYIKLHCDNTILTASSVNSPQGIILARVAKEFGLKFILGIGGVKSWYKHPLVKKAEELGAEIKILSKFGYNSVLYNKMKRYKGFMVAFGLNVKDDYTSIMLPTCEQVENIPKGLDNLVIPVGSAITTAGILEGLAMWNNKPKTVYAIQIAGYNRMKVIYDILPVLRFYNINLKFIPYKKFPYSKEVYIKSDNEYLDPIYEAKAFDWMINNIDTKNEKTLFWIVGNTYKLRKELNAKN